MANVENPFDIFTKKTIKKAKIKALGNVEVKYRDLTMAEADAFSKRLVKDYGIDGSTPSIDFDEANEIKYEKAALILVEPKVTVEYLKSLPSAAMKAVAEINALIENEDVGLDDEGN